MENHPPSVTVVNHIGLSTNDIERAQKFYIDVLGFTFDRERRFRSDEVGVLRLDPPSNLHAVYLLLGGFTLELLQYDPVGKSSAGARVFNETGLSHLSFSVDDLPNVIKRAEAYGAVVFSHERRPYMIRDPDGQLIELLPLAYHEEIAADRAARTSG